MIGIIGIVRVCAVVGLSAVSLISSVVKAKNNDGLINQNQFCNNGTPYNYETGDANMNNTMYNSRRFGYYNQMSAPQPMMAGPMMMGQPNFIQRPLSFSVAQPSPQLQQTLNQYGYATPGYNGYAQPQVNPMSYSRRNINYVPQQFMQPQMPTYPQQYGYSNNYGYVEPAPQQTNWWQQYNTPTMSDGTQSLYTNYQPLNTSYGYGYTDNSPSYQSMNNYPQQQQMNSYASNDGWYIGCLARKEYCASPASSYSGNGYYGYDERMPSYPPQPQQQRPMPQMMNMMMQPMMAPQQPMTPPPQQQPQISPMEEMRQRDEMRKREEYLRAMQMMDQQRQSQPQQQPQYKSSVNMFETIKPFDTNNAWFDDSTLPQPPQQAMPQPQVVPPPSPQQMTPPPPQQQQMAPPPQQMQQPNPQSLTVADPSLATPPESYDPPAPPTQEEIDEAHEAMMNTLINHSATGRFKAYEPEPNPNWDGVTGIGSYMKRPISRYIG